MTFAQPIRRPASSASTSPSWLTSGVSSSAVGVGVGVGVDSTSPSAGFANHHPNGSSGSGGGGGGGGGGGFAIHPNFNPIHTHTHTHNGNGNGNGNGISSAGPSSGGSFNAGLFSDRSSAGNGGAYGNGGGAGAGSGTSAGSQESRRHEQDLINAYEAEEERIINVLSRKLEQLREDKIDLENALEAESESHVNRLSRELQALRQRNRELEAQLAQANAQLQVFKADSSPSPATSPSPTSTSTSGRRKAKAKDKDKEEEEQGVAATPNLSNLMSPPEPSAALMLDAMQRENEALRNRLVDTERDYVRVSRLNEVYREELIEHRSRLGLSVDNLIGLTSSDRDPFAHPTHHRSRSSSVSSSPFYSTRAPYPSSVASTSTHVPQLPSHAAPVPLPIPRPPSQIHRPLHPNTAVPSASMTPLSISPSSAASGTSSSYPLSPVYSISGASESDSYLHGAASRHHHHRRGRSGSGTSGATPASFVSVSTNLTTPASSVPVAGAFGVGGAYAVPQRGLSYPSVPPPSLSSSFGSPTVSFHMPHRDASLSPVEPLSRRGSIGGGGSGSGSAQHTGAAHGTGAGSRRGSQTQTQSTGGERRIAESGSLRRAASGVPIGARVAETGSLAGGRSRAGSVNVGYAMPETVVEDDDDDDDDAEIEGMDLDEGGGEGKGEGEGAGAGGEGDGTLRSTRSAGGGSLRGEVEGTLSAKSRLS